MLMYKGLIRPSLECCASMINNLNKQQCEVVQNDVLKVMLQKGRCESGTEMRNHAHRRVKLVCLIYKSLKDGTPKYIKDILPSKNIYNRTHSGGWVVLMCNLEVYKTSYEYQGITTWNILGCVHQAELLSTKRPHLKIIMFFTVFLNYNQCFPQHTYSTCYSGYNYIHFCQR